MTSARDAHAGLSFTSARTVGIYYDKEPAEEPPLYTRVTEAIDEEDWAVKNAVLATFFLVLIFACTFGMCCGVHCCARACGYRKE